tara:strand:+ start:3114 stop:3563 length:450 start_codon:yes stop_codon:yes gene_type:complete
MMVKVTDGQITPYSVGRLRRDNPNTSFPKNISDATLASYGVYKVEVDFKPEHDERTQKLVSDDVVFDGTNATRSWSVVSLNEDELAENADRTAKANRTKRDGLLANTDWMALSDVTMTTEMTTYRQALRDITTHTNWPNLEEVDWPTKP